MDIGDTKRPTNTIPEKPDAAIEITPDPFVEKRGPNSLKGAPDSTSEGTQDSDDADAAEIGTEHMDQLQEDLENGALDSIISETSETGQQLSEDERKWLAQSIVRSAIKRGVTNIKIVSLDAGKGERIEDENGEARWIKLGEDEKSRIIWMSGKPIMILNNNLSEEEILSETSSYFANEIDRISNWYGLKDSFNRLFSHLTNSGLLSLSDQFGFYDIPRLLLNSQQVFFERNSVESKHPHHIVEDLTTEGAEIAKLMNNDQET